MIPAVRDRLREIYAAADAAVTAAGPRCDASGRCCRFREYGHTLFLSLIEAEHLIENAPPFEPPIDDAGCPFQVNGLCTTREPRPLACRLYFCDPAYQTTAAELSERFIRELKSLCDDFGIPWRYAPLHVLLRESREIRSRNPDQGSKAAVQNPESELRRPLPMASSEC
jgi:Fe-S-cluster containining protein